MGAGKEKRSAKAEKEKSGKGGKKGRGGAAAAAAAAAEEKKPEDEAGADGAAGGGEDVLTVLDTIWPKKEGLTLVKWCVPGIDLGKVPTCADELTSDPLQPRSRHCSSITRRAPLLSTFRRAVFPDA